MKQANRFLSLCGALVGAAVLATPATAQGTLTPTKVPTLTDQQQEILSYLTLEMIDDGTGTLVPTIRVNGANLQVVNGLGSTQTTNSAGNLIVGYNELGNLNGDDRTGSHNISFGEANSFSSFGGLVGPRGSTVSGQFASVSGGRDSVASGDFSSVTGGRYNEAAAIHTWVSGGRDNLASGNNSSISGGRDNTTNSLFSSISGGRQHVAGGRYSSISGGLNNSTSAWFASVSGGFSNTVTGSASSISGGSYNTAGGYNASISGGRSRSVTGYDNWRGGSLFEDH